MSEKKRRAFWWLSTFGRVEVEVVTLGCPRGHGSQRPFPQRIGLRCRSKSPALERVLTDFGAEESFGRASQRLKEHYGLEMSPAGTRRVVLKEASRAEAFVARQLARAQQSYQQRSREEPGVPWLVVETDGSMVRTGKLEADPEGGLTARRRVKRQRRQSARCG